MTNRFITVMERIGHDALIALEDVVKYLPEAAMLAKIIFPEAAPAIDVAVNVTGLIQNAVVTVEQKMAAGGKATGTGTQKLADVLQIVTPVVTQLLTQAGVKADTAYITNLVNAVVAILNVQQTTLAAAPSDPAPVAA